MDEISKRLPVTKGKKLIIQHLLGVVSYFYAVISWIKQIRKGSPHVAFCKNSEREFSFESTAFSLNRQ
ncbi:hypothetical protein KDRO_B07290 [Kluyveromyces lactis]|nr:hypothetical protein KDRO_B07290 [Kluyveromyces lactis]